MVTSEQIRAARALKGLSQAEVAGLIGTTTKTIQRAETDAGKVAVKTIEAICKALEKAGVEFIKENGGGPGVRLKK